jgi:enoyl-CoA hydratase/carnithine racemase
VRQVIEAALDDARFVVVAFIGLMAVWYTAVRWQRSQSIAQAFVALVLGVVLTAAVALAPTFIDRAEQDVDRYADTGNTETSPRGGR